MPSPAEKQPSDLVSPTPLPLSALLSQALVAFTIEFDNESEHQMPHRTTNHGWTADSPFAPWLVSLAMYENCLRHVGEDGVTVRALEELARTFTNLNGMERWGYIVVAPDPADRRPKPPHRDWVVRAKRAGRKAQEILRPLFGAIEKRWRERFGDDAIHELRASLLAVIRQIDVELPDCMPIVGYGLFSKGPDNKPRPPAAHDDQDLALLPLSALLAKVLLWFAIEFERESELSLAVSANVVRVLDEKAIRVRDLPRLSGVSKELITVALGFLQKRGCIVLEKDPSAGAKLVRLTKKGQQAQGAYRHRVDQIEESWRERFGKENIRSLRESLERIVGEPGAQPSPLFQGLEPYPEGWRASVPKPETLPHFPLVTHRGGFPDGS
jgi:DNA-binding MarR family transcriptional regulator